MNKTTPISARFLTGVFLWLLICTLTLTVSVRPVSADAAPPPDPALGGAVPYHPQKTNVQMMAETVVIDAVPNPSRWGQRLEMPLMTNRVRVNASFTMRNRGDTEEQMQVIFPLTHLHYPSPNNSYSILEKSFTAKVNGQAVTTTKIETPPDLSSDTYPTANDMSLLPDGVFVSTVKWAAFDVTFPTNKDVLLEVEYWMDGGDQGLRSVDYILETGIGWYGPILSADIIMRLPYPATRESVPDSTAGYSFSGNEVHWKLRNFEPTRADNLHISFMDTNLWPAIVELRTRVGTVPKDADAWYRLAEKSYSISMMPFMGGPIMIHPDMFNLAVKSAETATRLQPTWGDAHIQLARILWLGIPEVNNQYRNFGQKTELDINNPTVQRVIKEVNLAIEYGLRSDNDLFFIYSINQFFPDLHLTEPQKLNATPTPDATDIPTLETPQKAMMISVGVNGTCTISIAGEAKCGQIYVPEGIAAAAVGKSHICLVTTSGTVRCSGKNEFGQLGSDLAKYQATLIDVKGLTGKAKAIVAGDDHTCVLTTGGAVKCWGRNYFGQLGNGKTAYSALPVNVEGLSQGVVALTSGNNHTCALLSNSIVKCWGDNNSGQLGNGTRINSSKPVNVQKLPKNVVTLAAGLAHTCAVTSQGELVCWGDNTHGQIGRNAASLQFEPVVIPGLENNIKAVTAGDRHTCVLTSDGTVKCWGQYPISREFVYGSSPSPVTIDDLPSTVIALAAASERTCALMENGTTKCWNEFEAEPEITVIPSSPTPQETFTPQPSHTQPQITPETPTPTIFVGASATLTTTPQPKPTSTITPTNTPKVQTPQPIIAIIIDNLAVILIILVGGLILLFIAKLKAKK